jgi:hypothetical protein
MQLYTNNNNVPLSIAVWLARDEYDHVEDPFYISATTLIKSPRQIILGMRQPKTQQSDLIDISAMMSSRLGTAVHGSIEDTWLNHYKDCLVKLGYPAKIIERIRVNPTKEELNSNIIPVYMEQRVSRQVGRWTLGGKYDFVGNGTLEDFKTTGVFSFMSGSNEWKYCLQGSLYRWLNPEIITSDHMNINFIFTDWVAIQARIKADKGYPATRIMPHKVMLKSLAETEVWVQRKIATLDFLLEAPEKDLPLCEAQDLWQDPPVFKYYKNPEKKTRSTANFSTSAEAQIRWIQDGRVGEIVEVPGSCKGCLYCDAFMLCSQKDRLLESGALKL